MILLTKFVLTLIIFTLTSASEQSKDLLEVERTIKSYIFKDYDRYIRPPGKNGTGPVVVEVNTYVRSITNIDDLNMHYDVQLTFRQMWHDNRLRYETRTKELEYISMTSVESLWTPDFFFTNEMSGHFHYMITPNTLVRIYPDGRILYSTRVSLRLACPMDLKSYPVDSQVCEVKGASYGYTTDGVEFLWKNKDPVQITKMLHLKKFVLTEFFTDYCTSKTNTGTYSCLKVSLMFRRALYHYLQRAYMPTAALVILSWIIFWINPKSSGIKLRIWMAVLVSILVVTIAINSTTPEVNYATALDVWIGVCICFILFVVIEIALVSNAVKKEEILQNQIACDDGVADKHVMRMEDGKRPQVSNYTSVPLKWLNKYNTQAQRIDVVSRFLFPATFGLFNFIYWLTYAAGRE